jgi:DoxX-like family
MKNPTRIVAIFLALSYGVGAPLMGVLEIRRHLLSGRFGYPPALIYAVCAAQVLCAAGVLTRRYALLAAVVLTITTVGAVASHVKIGSPLTAIPALIYTVLQVWFGLKSREIRVPQA